MFSAAQLVAHLWGDYILQSDWMAQNKTKAWFPAACHAVVYSLLFLLFRPSLLAFAVIVGSHYLIDRYRLARYVVWAKNWIWARRYWWVRRYSATDVQWSVTDNGDTELPLGVTNGCWHAPTPPIYECPTGYPQTSPAWLSVWLLIFADNTLHVTINALALKFL